MEPIEYAVPLALPVKCNFTFTNMAIPDIDPFDTPETYRYRLAVAFGLPIRWVVFAYDRNITGCDVYDKRITTIYNIIDQGKTMSERRELITKYIVPNVNLSVVYLIIYYYILGKNALPESSTPTEYEDLLQATIDDIGRELNYAPQTMDLILNENNINTILIEINQETQSTILEFNRIDGIYQQIRLIIPDQKGQYLSALPPREISNFKHLGYKRLLTPTFANTNIAPQADDISLLIDLAEPTPQIPVIVAQMPGRKPIIKYYTRITYSPLLFDIKAKVKFPCIYGMVILSNKIQKNRLMTFTYNLNSGVFSYVYTESASTGIDIFPYLVISFPALNLLGAPRRTTESRFITQTLLLNVEEEEEEEEPTPPVYTTVEAAEAAEESAVVTAAEQYAFLVHNLIFDTFVLFDMAGRLSFFSNYIYLNQIEAAFPEMRNPYMYFRFPERPHSGKIKINAKQVTLDPAVVEIKLTTTDPKVVAPLIAVFSYLMSWLMLYQRPSLFVTIPVEYRPPETTRDFYAQLIGRPIPPAVQQKDLRYREPEKLSYYTVSPSVRYPEIFLPNYDELVPADRAPMVISKKELDRYPNLKNIIELPNSEYALICPGNFPVLQFKTFEGKRYPICTSSQWLIPGRGENMFITPTNKVNINMIRQTLTPSPLLRTPVKTPTSLSSSPIASGNAPETIGAIKPLVKTATLSLDKYARIDNNVKSIIEEAYQLETDQKSDYWRKGSWIGPNSILYCILDAIEDPRLRSIKMDQYYLYLNTVRQDIVNKIHPEICKQELYDLTNKQIIDNLLDPDYPLDTALFYRAIEEYFEVNLMVWTLVGENVELEIPRNQCFHARTVNITRPCIILFKQNITETSNSANPHYELIVQLTEKTGSLKVFGDIMSQQLRNLYYQREPTRVYYDNLILDNPFAYWNPYQVLTRQNMIPKITGQVIDKLGKQRGVVLKYRDGLIFSVFGPPRQPENCPSVSTTVPVIDLNLLLVLMEVQPTACTVVNGNYVGLWYPCFGMNRCLYIPIKPVAGNEKINSLDVIDSPYVKYHLILDNNYNNYQQAKKLQIRLLSIIQWLWTINKNQNELKELLLIDDSMGIYDFTDLAPQVPEVKTLAEAIQYLSQHTRNLIKGGRLVVFNQKLYNNIIKYWRRLESAGNPRLKKAPIYLSGFYQNYDDFRQDRGDLVLNQHQLELKISPKIKSIIYPRLPHEIMGTKIIDSLVLHEPIVLIKDGRHLLLTTTFEKTPGKELESALVFCAHQVWPGVQIDITNVKNYKYVVYWADPDGSLSVIEDHTDGQVPYLEVAKLGVESKYYYIAILSL